MTKRHAALRTTRWLLLAACLVLLFLTIRILWWDVGQGLEVRDTERIESVNSPSTLPPWVNPQ